MGMYAIDAKDLFFPAQFKLQWNFIKKKEREYVSFEIDVGSASCAYLIEWCLPFVWRVCLLDYSKYGHRHSFFLFKNTFAYCSKMSRRNKNVNHIFFLISNFLFIFFFLSVWLVHSTVCNFCDIKVCIL